MEKPELKARVKLLESIFKNFEECGVEDTITWMRHRLEFEKKLLREKYEIPVSPLGTIDKIKAYRLKHGCSLRETADAIRKKSK